MYTIQQAREAACRLFLKSPVLNRNGFTKNGALLDADLLIGFLLQKERTWIITHSDDEFAPFKEAFDALVQRRAEGMPVAYLIGKKEFFNRPFFVNTDVLIPKPDTETLVERALDFLKEKWNFQEETAVLDMCTGSGCIGISLIMEWYGSFFLEKRAAFSAKQAGDNCITSAKTDFFPEEKIVLVLSDISCGALAVCKKNAKALLPQRVLEKTLLVKADVNDCFPLINGRQYSLITANPPYVPAAMTDTLLADGRSEPRLALDGGVDGLNLIKPLAKNAFAALKPKGALFVEVGEYHACAACTVLEEAGFQKIVLHRDLAGYERVIEAKK